MTSGRKISVYAYQMEWWSSMLQILYVDDEMGLLEIGKIFIEQSGDAQVDTALSGKEAMSLMSTKVYDAVISDYQMPEINGIELLKMVRNQQKGVPFILFTGKGREEVVIEALNNGADFYLQKGGDPVSQFAELRHHLRQAISRHRAELMLRKSEERFRTLIENAPVALGVGRHGRMLYANQRFMHMFGYDDKAEFLKMDFNLLLEPSERDLGPLLPADSEAGTILLERELTGLRRDGTPFPFHIIVASISLEDGPGHLAVFTDITEQKRVEERFQEILNRLTLAMNMASIAFWKYNVSTKTMELNDQFFVLLGTTAEREGGYLMSRDTYLQEFVHPDDRERLAEIENKDYATGHPYPYLQYKYRVKRRDGSVRIFVIRLNFIKDDRGRVATIEGVCQDITDQNKVFTDK